MHQVQCEDALTRRLLAHLRRAVHHTHLPASFYLPHSLIRDILLVDTMASEESKTAFVEVNDPSSYANLNEVRANHIAVDWTVNFEETLLAGTATIRCESVCDSATKVVFDSRDLNIESITVDGANRRCCCMCCAFPPTPLTACCQLSRWSRRHG